ncbi:MAG: GNAT family protein [Nitrospira sp.]|uniref:GNAT family N-acetyltransferase n=1 Tax=Nitrospira sp. ND1 TaxID=1658518 RepID=UPI0009C5FBC1|nr:GNAT family protein [Nitrospira sp. ND1]MBK7420858.1 GNAT family N-acetyltransferase [Nitrospira sp.]MBK7488062.1 GNAT family N-acetyltransferase [Nitrospira sp.]MBK9998463.1 GNAT family N-acetyltransferase [Nitrospira sp.]MBP6200609.1 GNAT family N-acetyltransferase [Nitrospira sp.]MBP6205968.1 GNAT family N-acetyltransferase [Nitrospira sp.]
MITVMDACPTLHTERLILRQFQPSDADTVQRLAGAKEVAAGTLLPHPFEVEAAAQLIAQQQEQFAAGTAITIAIVLAEEEQLIGSIGMDIASEHQLARLSYWLGTDYWNRGYCTEAVRAVIDYGFTRLSLHRIYAPHFHNNPASGRVLRKIGMTYEGRMREHYIRFGRFVDVEIYGILREEFLNDSAHSREAVVRNDE